MHRAPRSSVAPLLPLLLLLLAPASFAQLGANPPAPPPEHVVPVFGQPIHYWDMGAGPVVVLLHGMGDRKESWLPVIPVLSKSYRVLAPDQIGFGKSAKPLLDYTVQTYVDFLDEFLRELKIEKVDLVGESLDGWIAGLYAVDSSSDAHMVPLERLVLVDAAGLRQNRPVPNLNPSTREGMRRLLAAVFYDTSWLNDATLRRIFADKLAANDAYTVHSIMTSPVVPTEVLDDRLGEIHVPTLVLWGKQDQLLPLAAGQRYASGVLGARLVTFDHCGHVPGQEKTAEFLAALTSFLGGPRGS
jgi:pimeloyl-ACP methyl ester carboxylesterase